MFCIDRSTQDYKWRTNYSMHTPCIKYMCTNCWLIRTGPPGSKKIWDTVAMDMFSFYTREYTTLSPAAALEGREWRKGGVIHFQF